MVEIAVDIEINVNNKPLTYVDNDTELPIITPNSLIYGHSIRVPENEFDDDNTNLLKRQRYIKHCKQAAWNRWKNDYPRALRKRHDMKHKSSKKELKQGDISIIKSDEKNRGKWKIGISSQLFKGQDGVIRGVRLRAGKSYLEQPIQYLYPLELNCDKNRIKSITKIDETKLNAKAKKFRPKRNSAAIAK